MFLTSNPRSFQNTTAISTGLSDYHKLNLRETLRSNLEQGNCDSDYQKFEHIFMSTLDKHAPSKKKMLRC